MRTIFFKNEPSVIGVSSVGGPKESVGVLGEYIEFKSQDDTFGEKTFEKAEKKMLYSAIDGCIKNASKEISDINAIIADTFLTTAPKPPLIKCLHS